MQSTRILPTLAALALGITSSHAAISVVNTGQAWTTTGNGASANLSKVAATLPDTGYILTHSYDAGASFDMLVVTVSREGGTFSLKYDGVEMISATGPSGTTGVDIFYLNTAAQSGDLVADFTNSGTNGIGIGIAAIKSDNGDPIGLFDAARGNGTTIDVDTADDSFSIFGIDTNLGGFSGMDTPPLNQIFRRGDVGSNGASAAYELVTTGQTGKTYSYTNTANPRGITAANFVVVPEPSAAALLGLGGALLLRRRRARA